MFPAFPFFVTNVPRKVEPLEEAVELLARTEGILLDPVYTGKAMAGLLDLVRRGAFRSEENVVFLHTGGVPALFADTQAPTFYP